MSYLYNDVPIIPGAYLVNGTTSSTNQLYQLPIFGTASNVSNMGFGNADDIYYVLPGYKLLIYSNIDFGGTLQTIDNTTGTKIMYKNASTANSCQSIKMYYNNDEILGKYTYTSYPSGSGSTTTTPISNNINGPYKLLNMPIFPGAYLIDAGAIGTFPIFCSISSLVTYIDTQASDRDDAVLLMPGYKLILWNNANYGETSVAIDNTTGSTIIVGLSSAFGGGGWTANTTSSVQLFYNGNEVLQTDIIA
jgi:hypothetical protein